MSTPIPSRSVPIAGLFSILALALIVNPVRADLKPFDLNMDRVKVTAGNGYGYSKTYFIPSVVLNISAFGDIWSQAKSGTFVGGKDLNAQAHGKFWVKGLDKPFVQELARKVQDDLVAKLRANGCTVLTYDDLKEHPELAGHGRSGADSKWGLPTMKAHPLTYVVATPSDAQAFDRPITGPVFWMRGLAKEKQMVILVPEINFTVPQMWGEKDTGYKRASAGIGVNPAMKLGGAFIFAINGKGTATNIHIQEHGMRLAAEVAGTVKLASEDKTSFTSEWQRTSSDWLMTLDPQAFSDGILRVSYAINTLIANEVKKALK